MKDEQREVIETLVPLLGSLSGRSQGGDRQAVQGQLDHHDPEQDQGDVERPALRLHHQPKTVAK